MVKVDLEKKLFLIRLTPRHIYRVLILFIVFFPLSQYLGSYQVDPHLPWWQEDPLFNTLLGITTYLGLSGLKALNRLQATDSSSE